MTQTQRQNPTQTPTKVKKVEQLSAEAREVVKARKLSGSYELRRLFKLLGELAEFDEATGASRKSASNWMIGFIIATVVVFVLAFVIFPYGLILPVITVSGAIIMGLKHKRLSAVDLIDDFRTCLQPALRDLSRDLDPNQKIKVEMDLAGPVETKKKGEKDLPPGRNTKLTETIYEDPWCEVRLPLADGATATLEFSTTYYKYYRRYRTSRGKTKSKTKWCKECTARATLVPPVPVAWQEQTLARAAGEPGAKAKLLTPKGGVQGAQWQKTWSFKGVGDAPADAAPAREVVGILMRLYGAMRPVGSKG